VYEYLGNWDNLLTTVAVADKQTFPHLDTVGWYATGPSVQETDMLIHRLVSGLLYLFVATDVSACCRYKPKPLPAMF
jgi:hypothetical protein